MLDLNALSAVITLLINYYYISTTEAICPPSNALQPCVCNEQYVEIICGGDYEYDIKAIFQTISHNLPATDKHFKGFRFNNSMITELANDTTLDISFEAIDIYEAKKLRRISTNAFRSSNLYAKNFIINSAPIENDSKDYSLFDLLNSMINLEELQIRGTRISDIPSNAFRAVNGSHQKLRAIYIKYNDQFQHIRDNLFYYLDNLEKLDLGHNQLIYIPENMFNFRSKGERKIVIDINNNLLNSSNSIALQAFSNITKRVETHIGYNDDFSYLDENIFASYLSNGNEIYLTGLKLTCDCKMFWLYKTRSKYANVIIDAFCSDGQSIFEFRYSYNNCTK